MLLAFALLQAVAGPPLPLTRRPVATPCPPAASTDDVVVCARSQDAYRLVPLPPRPDAPAVPKAEIAFGGGRLAAEAEQATMAGDQQSRRLMVRWKIPLGRKPKSATDPASAP